MADFKLVIPKTWNSILEYETLWSIIHGAFIQELENMEYSIFISEKNNNCLLKIQILNLNNNFYLKNVFK